MPNLVFGNGGIKILGTTRGIMYLMYRVYVPKYLPGTDVFPALRKFYLRPLDNFLNLIIVHSHHACSHRYTRLFSSRHELF